MSKPIIYMAVGLVASGKSTWAETHKEELNAVVHSSDAIRAELGDVNDQTQNDKVFRILHQRIKDDLKSGKNVIYDATNLSRKNRVHFLKNELNGIECEKVCILFATPWEECLARNFARERQVPEEVMIRMYKNFETPYYTDGFDDIQIIYSDILGTYGFEYDICVDLEKWKKIDHKNPHHSMSIGNHMLAACDYIKDKTNDIRLITTTLLHDIGKESTRSWNAEKDHYTYYQHHCVGSYLALFYLKRMYPEWSEKDILYVSLLINLHMRPLLSWRESDNAKEKDRRLFGDDILQSLELLNESDIAAH